SSCFVCCGWPGACWIWKPALSVLGSERGRPACPQKKKNKTAKIISRRAGELPECYKDLDKMLAVLSYNYYTDRPKGRSDCPQRVHNKFDKQEITGYNETREAGKDYTRAHFTATVYQEAKYD
ncbi:hypothetical protein B7939_11590, partial [Eggerthia catenaformis]